MTNLSALDWNECPLIIGTGVRFRWNTHVSLLTPIVVTEQRFLGIHLSINFGFPRFSKK